uniref:Uncharacterized protein n=1 Tax=Mesocestoides corti TaxID=53468 RepID=A0A5K3FVJ1_MESCO
MLIDARECIDGMTELVGCCCCRARAFGWSDLRVHEGGEDGLSAEGLRPRREEPGDGIPRICCVLPKIEDQSFRHLCDHGEPSHHGPNHDARLGDARVAGTTTRNSHRIHQEAHLTRCSSCLTFTSTLCSVTRCTNQVFFECVSVHLV